MNRTKITQLVKASVLPAVRRDIAALARSVNCMNIIKATPIQLGREKYLYGRTVMLGGIWSRFLDDKDGTYLAMPAEELRDLWETFKVYAKSTFKNYTMVLKNEVIKENKNWPEPWKIIQRKHIQRDYYCRILKLITQWTQMYFGNLTHCHPFEFFKIHLDPLKIEIRKIKI